MRDLVSIVVPIYNVEKYLDRCISSLINQTYKNLEIILINDGSTDSSLTICNKYKNDKRIKVYSRENKGLLYTRIDGIKKATGKYLMFVDSDDYIDKEMIEYMVNILKENKCQMVKCGYKYDLEHQFYVTKELIEITSTPDEAYNKLITRSNLNSIWAELIVTKLLKKHISEIDYSISNGEDVHFNMIMYQYYTKIAYINKNFYNYQYSIDSMSHGFQISKVKNKIADLIKVYTYFIEKMQSDNKVRICNKTLIEISNNIMSLSNSDNLEFSDIYHYAKQISANSIMNKVRNETIFNNIKSQNKKETIMGKLFYLKYIKLYSIIIYLNNRVKKRGIK